MTSFEWFSSLAPEGHFVCSYGFESHPVEDAWRDATGQGWDVCQRCKFLDEVSLARRAGKKLEGNPLDLPGCMV